MSSFIEHPHFEIAGAQIQGRRESQEDAFHIGSLGAGETDEARIPFVTMADGVGGHGEGRLASHLVLTAFRKHLNSAYRSPQADVSAATIPNSRSTMSAKAGRDLLLDALTAANNTLRQAIINAPKLKGMGCTLVAVVLMDSSLYWVSVGDSHLYLVRNKQFLKLNAIHNQGTYLDEQARLGIPIVGDQDDRARKALTSVVAGEHIALIDCPTAPLQLLPGDLLMVASDGLDAVSPGRIVYCATAADSAQACVTTLLDAVSAVGHPRQDNTTVIAIRCA